MKQKTKAFASGAIVSTILLSAALSGVCIHGVRLADNRCQKYVNSVALAQSLDEFKNRKAELSAQDNVGVLESSQTQINSQMQTQDLSEDDSGYKKATYTIQRGDTLTRISEALHVSVADLIRWNNICDADRIYAGDTLVYFVS